MRTFGRRIPCLSFVGALPTRVLPCSRATGMRHEVGRATLRRSVLAPRRRTRYIGSNLTRMTGAEAGVRPTERQHLEEVDPGVVEGTDLQVLKYPHPLLRKPNAEFSAKEIEHEAKQIAKEMLAIMYASNGVGLAAPQVGINKRLMVFNPQGDAKAWLQEVVLVNPRIVGKSKSSDVELEGCLSFPGMKGHVRRHEWVKIEATRLNGKKFKIKYEGWAARIFQHEYDHLDGVLYVDRLEHEDRELVQARLDELIANYRSAPYSGMDAAL